MENKAQQLTTVNAQDGPSLSVVGDTYRILISGEETGGAYTVIDMLIPPHGGPGPHAHPTYQEAFYIMEGEIEVRTESGRYTAAKGSFVNIPLGGMVHQFKNETQIIAHMLCIITPAGMEKMFGELGKPVSAGVFLPAPDLGPDLIKKFQQIAEKFGQQLYPPDYLDK
ncbi:MAG TPA: cupin domain-containing protein [Puia sp.]|nr:cupin domain-containing protein [Puia sp.]